LFADRPQSLESLNLSELQNFQLKLQNALESRRSEGLLRELRVVEDKIDFSSNDYLGLARNAELKAKVDEVYQSLTFTNKLGSTGSRLISGNSQSFEDLETFLADTHLAVSALLFNTGYMANLAVFSTLPQKGDTVLYDELSHACIKDGIRLSLAERFSFLHNDLHSLENKLKKAKGQVFVAVESVYSMDGDFAPLAELATLCEKYDAILIVDEAHSTGVFGGNGSGLVCELGLEKRIPIRIHTFGKAMGCHGAVVVGPKELRPYLINFARPFIYTTAMSLHSVVSIKESYRYLAQNAGLQKSIAQNVKLFNSLISGPTIKIQSESAIQALLFSGNENARKKAADLQNQGFDVRPILSPTVKKGSERMRICLHTYNTETEIKELVKAVLG
jgi:8-amino-7-oxononanoate synthase